MYFDLSMHAVTRTYMYTSTCTGDKVEMNQLQQLYEEGRWSPPFVEKPADEGSREQPADEGSRHKKKGKRPRGKENTATTRTRTSKKRKANKGIYSA